MARIFATLLLSFVIASCTQVYTAPAPGPTGTRAGGAAPGSGGASGAADADSPFKKWDEVLKNTRAIDGYFRTHLKRDNTLFLEIPAARLDEQFGMVLHFSQGVGVFNAHDGLQLSDTKLMRFERQGDRIYLVEVNPRFTADEGSAMANSLAGNVGHSVVHAFDIESEHAGTGALLIDATTFFVSDYSQVGSQLTNYYGQTNRASFQRDRSHVDNVGGFPRNVEIDAFLTYSANRPPQGSSAGVSDWRSIPIGVRYSIFQLPETPMARRAADDRVGYFLTAQRDFSRDREDSQYVRYINRWRLEKRDPDAAVSEPVQPIVYYIDRSVPERYREYVRAGIENWNRAFEAAGFRNAIVARQAPTVEEDPTWSAEDIRYSTVRWSAAHQMGYAIGPSQVDPRTGEILNADILISSIFISGYRNDWEQLAGPDGMIARQQEAERLMSLLPAESAQYMCTFETGRAHQMGIQNLALAAFGEIGAGPMPEEYLGEHLTDLIMHEVGHTLGLRHNMKGSSAIPFDRLDDEAFTADAGLTLSVMEYGAVNINPDRDAQGHYVNQTVGAYDLWAIRYGYQPASDAELMAIAGESAEPLHTYGTDEDVGFGGWGVDPNTDTWDLSGDPLRWIRQRAELIELVAPQMEGRVVSEGEEYLDLRNAVNGLIFERYGALQSATKVIGGLYFNRDHRGQPGQRPAFVPVTADRQREAVRVLMEHAFDEGAWRFEESTLNRLAPNRYGDFANQSGGFPVDYAVHAQVGAVQQNLMGLMIDHGRLWRMVDNELRMPDGEPYTLAEYLRTVTDGIWSEIFATPARTPDSFRRNGQRMYLDGFEQMLLKREGSAASPPAPEDARSLARHHLTRIADRIDEVLDRITDDMHAAHLAESRARIRRALEASMMIEASD
jgi:hypothetical protein